jgi:hypothetical protein
VSKTLRDLAAAERVIKGIAKPLTPKDVWDAPVDFNRSTRRWARLWGSIWAWDRTAEGTDIPRYVRRHYSESIVTHPHTRRQRRHRARILRVMRAGVA